MSDDIELLRQYAGHGSEEAFAALVTRHVNLVYSAALRKTSNPSAAEEITQAVFIILARKADRLRKNTILSGWLYQTARLTAAGFLRTEIRRARREQEAYMQSSTDDTEADDWTQIAPLLEDAMGKLGDDDRAAVVLRFFENKSFLEVGAAFGASENAAKKRVGRALEKLRRSFAKRGVASTSEIIAASISANSIQNAPMAIANSVTAVAIAKGAAASGSTLTLIKGALKIMAWTKTKIIIAVGISLVLAASTTTVVLKNYSRPAPIAEAFAREQQKILLKNWTVANSREPEISLLPYWWSQTFEPISTDEKFRAQIFALDFERESDLTENQNLGLHQAIYNLLLAFNLEDYDAYRAFRTPAPARFQFDPEKIELKKQYLREDWKNPDKEAPEDSEKLFRKFWEVVYLNKYVSEPAGTKYSTIGKNLWRGVNLGSNNTEIVVEDIASPSELTKYKSSRKGSAQYSSTVTFEDSPESILQQQGHVKCATVKCLIQYAEPELSNPVYCRY